GQFALTGHGDMRVLLWDLQTGKLLRRFEGAFGAVHAVTFCDHGRFIAAHDSYGVLSVWQTKDAKLIRQTVIRPRFESSEPTAPENGAPAAPGPPRPDFTSPPMTLRSKASPAIVSQSGAHTNALVSLKEVAGEHNAGVPLHEVFNVDR